MVEVFSSSELLKTATTQLDTVRSTEVSDTCFDYVFESSRLCSVLSDEVLVPGHALGTALAVNWLHMVQAPPPFIFEPRPKTALLFFFKTTLSLSLFDCISFTFLYNTGSQPS